MSATIENNLQINLSQCLPTCDKNKNYDVRYLVKKIKFWMARSRQRKQLARLDERLLRDIGYTREQVQREISKPFWK